MYGFEDSDYSTYAMFMKSNLIKTNAYHYLTKEQADNGVCHIGYPYQITQGSLPPITYTYNDELVYQGIDVYTDINIGNINMNDFTTVSVFSQAVVENNEGFEYGDKISFIFGKTINANINDIYFKGYTIVLDQNDENYLYDSVGFERNPETGDLIDGYGFQKYNGFLSSHFNYDYNLITCAWVHSRHNINGIFVSTQSLLQTRGQDTDSVFKNVLGGYGYDWNEYFSNESIFIG